jgi:hypothetical protein
MNRRHLHNLCALLGEDLDVERARDEYLASLDADQGLAVLLISLFAIRLKWLPAAGASSFRFLILPAIVLALPSIAIMQRLDRLRPWLLISRLTISSRPSASSTARWSSDAKPVCLGGTVAFAPATLLKRFRH